MLPATYVAVVGTIAAELFDAFRRLVIMECGADVGACLRHDAETGAIVYRSDDKNAASHAAAVSRLARGAQWMREQGSGATLPCRGEVNQPAPITEGSCCPDCGRGTMTVQPGLDCSCHISPPCESCVQTGLRCDHCGWYPDPQ